MDNDQGGKIDLRPYSEGDFLLLEQLLGDPVMTEYLGGPESPDKLRQRHDRFVAENSGKGPIRIFVITAGPENVAVGSIAYWEREWQGRTVWETGWSVLPRFQGQGIATKALQLMRNRVQGERKHRFIHAFPSIDNGPSNALCRKAGFTLQKENEFEYPPGHFMRCNDWCLELFSSEVKE